MIRLNRIRQFLLLLAVLSFLSLTCSSRLLAQGGASLDVVVVDPFGAVVANPAITLRGPLPATTEQHGNTAADGRFHFEVPPGRYRLTAGHESFHAENRDISLSAGPSHELRIPLQLEPLSEDVLVSAEALPIPTTTASEAVAVITHADIEQRQLLDMQHALSIEPGIMVAQADAGGGVASLFVDGGNSNFTKVVVDGVTLNQPGGAIDLSNFTLDGIDKIEIVRGAQSALVGSDAMTGVIEVLTHRGSTRTPQIILDGQGGSFSTGRGAAQFSGIVGRLDYSATTGYFTTDGQLPNNRFLNRTLSGNFGVRVGDEGSVRLTLRNNTSDAGTPGQTLFTPPNLDQHNALHNFAAALSWDGSTGKHWQHHVAGTESYIRQFFENPLSDFYTSPDPFDSCSFPRSAHAVPSAYCDFPYSSHNQFNRAGFQWNSSYIDNWGSLTAGYVYEVENAFLSALNGGHARRNNQAGFVDGRWQIVKRVVLNAGFRVEDNDNFGTKVVPRVGAAFTARNGGDVLGATRLHVNYGEGIKEPRLDQSFGTDICNPGNPTLLPERSRTAYAGVEQRLDHDRVRISGDYFESRFYDIVSFAFCFPGGPCPVTPPAGCPFGFGSYFNTDLTRARGTTISSEARINNHLSLSGNYTYDDTLVVKSPNAFDPSEIPGNHLLRQPVNSGNLALTGGMLRVTGTFAARIVGRRTDSDFLFPPLGLTSNPGFVVLSLFGSLRIDAHATAYARIDNLANRQYSEILGYPALGRAASAGMRFTFGGER
jgi:outer membrane cobalamin receptor